MSKKSKKAGQTVITLILPDQKSIQRQGSLAFQVDSGDRSPFQRQVIGLFNRISLYHETASVRTPYLIPPLLDGEQWAPMSNALMACSTAPPRPCQKVD